ncbi:alpha/beta fold hydrolase [Phenylobacterium immobile]|uniref:alpha/beta fold hydrolase n=1 Tax=Phenylobacterium immobile TaxID=21 RepID=UPI000A51430F|nr:alpha/beta fold hydrolase [Phenylobacterium immobile]
MRAGAILLMALALSACTPIVSQAPLAPPAGFAGPKFDGDRMISFDSARLGLTRWAPAQEPWAVIVALHGMNDYANAFHLAAPYWAEQGIATYAIDQRGFGRSPQRGIWAGRDLMAEDLRTAASLARAAYPKAVLVVMGESMGGAVAAYAAASDRPPEADRIVLLSPAVWGFETQPPPNGLLLWLAARFTGPKVYAPPEWVTDRISPTDNRDELIAMSQDQLMIWGARSDTLYGLVRLMGKGSEAMGRTRAPVLYLYGAHDEIIPKHAARRAMRGLRPGDRTAYYPDGWHLLTRDHQGPRVWADVAAYIRNPTSPLPSGVGEAPFRAPVTSH